MLSYLASQFHKPNGFGGRCATLAMNVINRAQYHCVMTLIPPQGHILDIGFGNGRMLKRLLQKGYRNLYGTEISESCLSIVKRKLLWATQKGYVHLQRGTAEQLPYDASCMDCIYSINTIYFWHTLHEGLQEIARVLKPQGTLMLACYDKKWMGRLPLAAHGFQLYELEEICTALKRNGFMCVRVAVVKENKAYCIYAKRL